jgi:hypothetical protein
MTSNSNGLHFPRIDGRFERIFALGIPLGVTCIPLRDILASEKYRQMLYLLRPKKRRQIKNAIQLEYYDLKRKLVQAHRDIMTLQKEYEMAISVVLLAPPIHRLPVELLREIFSFIIDEQNPDIGALMQTCHQWKEIVSSMWAALQLATWTSINRVKDVLGGGNGPLIVTIDPSSDAVDRPIDSLETERYAALMLAVSTSISRWRTIDIRSLPGPQQTSGFSGEQSHALGPVPMTALRSLNIPIRHDSSWFLDLLLPSISATASVSLTDMHLCSVQAMLYLAQPDCVQVFNYLTSFKCFLPRMGEVVDILLHFRQLEILDVSGLRFFAYDSDVELPLAKTLRQMSLRATSIGWMNRREFLRLDLCTIVSPPPDTLPISSLPLCTEFHFEGPCLDPIKKFSIPTPCTLRLHSTQWNNPRGNGQLSRLWGANPSEGVIRPMSLHLHLVHSSEQLLRALCFMPDLKELVLELDRPTALGRHFFIGILPLSLQTTKPRKLVGKSKDLLWACPSLEVLGLKYRRWFRPGESNVMPAVVAMAYLDNRNPKPRIWVEKGITNQERVYLDVMPLGASVLSSLGLICLVRGVEPPNEVVNEVIEAYSAIPNLAPIKFNYQMTMSHIPPSTYSCLFQQLRSFTFSVDISQRVLLEALAYFEHLEELHVESFSPLSSQPHLLLLKTLKKLQLGKTSLRWMEGCTFTKLEKLVLGGIKNADGGQPQCIQMPVCKSASFPQRISSKLLSAFKMPQLCDLDLHDRPLSPQKPLHYPSIKHFQLSTVSLHFGDNLGLQDALAMQPTLEVLEIQGFAFKKLPAFLDILSVPCKTSTFNAPDHGATTVELLRQKSPVCPKLKELKLKQGWVQELKQDPEWLRELEMKLKLEQQLEQEQVWMQEQVCGWEKAEKQVWERELERIRTRVREWERKHKHERECELSVIKGWYRKVPEVRKCRELMRQRVEEGYPLRCCQLAWGPYQTEITSELIGLPYLDLPDPELPSLGDIFTSWESRNLQMH